MTQYSRILKSVGEFGPWQAGRVAILWVSWGWEIDLILSVCTKVFMFVLGAMTGESSPKPPDTVTAHFTPSYRSAKCLVISSSALILDARTMTYIGLRFRPTNSSKTGSWAEGQSTTPQWIPWIGSLSSSRDLQITTKKLRRTEPTVLKTLQSRPGAWSTSPRLYG